MPIGHLLIDLGHARHAGLAAVAILDHARTEAERRRVGIHLVGAGPLMAAASPQVRQRLGRWRSFPSLDVARAALGPWDRGGTVRSTRTRSSSGARPTNDCGSHPTTSAQQAVCGRG